MGSQSVTNFSAVRMKRIREFVKDYSAKNKDVETQVRKIGAAVVGTSEKTEEPVRAQSGTKRKGTTGVAVGPGGSVVGLPSNEFLQALASPSVKSARDLIINLAKEIKEAKDLEEVYEKYGIKRETARPLGKVSAGLRKTHSDTLSANQAETESAFAAQDAISKTVMDIVGAAFPTEKEPVDIDRMKLTEALRKVSPEKIVTAYMENVAAALINLILDATRGSLPPARIAEIKRRIRERYVPELIEQLKSGK